MCVVPFFEGFGGGGSEFLCPDGAKKEKEEGAFAKVPSSFSDVIPSPLMPTGAEAEVR